MPPDIEVFHILQKHAVPFVVIGGHAVNLHGYNRATEDSDVIWHRSETSETLLLAALNEINARYLGNTIDPATGLEQEYPVSLPYIQTNRLMMLWTRYGFVDLFDYIPGFASTDVKKVFDTSIESGGLRFVSRDWLLNLKRASGRPKDLIDLENLESL